MNLREQITEALDRMEGIDSFNLTLAQDEGSTAPHTILLVYSGTATESTVFDYINHDALGRSLRPSGCDLRVARIDVDTSAYDRHIANSGSPRKAPVTQNVKTMDQDTPTPEVTSANRYPLFCVDRAGYGSDESRMYGPFETHDQALARLPAGEPAATVRRCRQLKPSEIKLTAQDIAESRDRWLNMRACDVHDAIVIDVDDHACGGYLPEGAWSRVGDQIVFGKLDDGTIPTPSNFATWLDEHVEVEAYICEGDE